MRVNVAVSYFCTCGVNPAPAPAAFKNEPGGSSLDTERWIVPRL